MWFVQERVLPEANRRQDALRAQIRGVPTTSAVASISTATQPQQWLAISSENRIYSYEHGAERGNELRNLTVYEFAHGGVHLRAVTAGRSGMFADGKLKIIESITYDLETGSRSFEALRELESNAGEGGGGELFKPLLIKPSHLNSESLSAYIKLLKRRGEAVPVRALILALERRQSDLIAPLVMALIGVPLALAFGRRSAVTALCMAVIVGLLFWAAVGAAQQAGINGWLPPTIAAWSPTAVFLAVGIYLLARART
jgi:lipopolysaccharide export LptBFGC system permease protein LptF